MNIRIDQRFRGPPDSGNGGYVAGLLASALGGSNIEVTLRSPPPLEVELDLEADGDKARLLHGETLIAAAVRSAVEVDVPAPPRFAEAEDAEARFAGLGYHLFPGCFVCGPDRAAGDGLRIFAGRIEPGGTVASTWIPGDALADGDGKVAAEYLWSALDCPGYFAVREAAGMALLGRIGAVIHRRPEARERLIVTGWPIGRDARKHRVGTALHDERGELVAAAQATWISLKN
ncbi:MAG: hypothetical protein M3Q57_10290 [Pseudomonadota bacterium]|nr:hypothetical protein [Pseudomonadota bacterium]